MSEKRLLRIERKNAETPIERKPEWIRTKLVQGPNYQNIKDIIGREDLHTVCQSAGCPNVFECWEDRESTFLIGGDACTRRCDFCQIESAKPNGFDPGEPQRVAESVSKLGLRYVTVTGVCRDDLPDEGAWLYAETIRKIHEMNPGVGVEMLAPDFSGKDEFLNQSSRRDQRFLVTTSRPSRGSSSVFAPASSMSFRWTSSPAPETTD